MDRVADARPTQIIVHTIRTQTVMIMAVSLLIRKIRSVLASKLKRKAVIQLSLTSIRSWRNCPSGTVYRSDQNIVFIVDPEAHRSNGDMFGRIKGKFPKSTWSRVCRDPSFDNDLTYKAFIDLLRTPTLSGSAISDHNVLVSR